MDFGEGGLGGGGVGGGARVINRQDPSTLVVD